MGPIDTKFAWEGHKSIIGAPRVCFRFQTCWYVSKCERLKRDYKVENLGLGGPNLTLFTRKN